VPLLPSYSTPPVSPRRGFDICQRELLIPSSAAASVRRQSIYRPFSAFGGGRLLVVAPGVGGISISSASRSPKRFRKARAANGVMDNDFMLRGQSAGSGCGRSLACRHVAAHRLAVDAA
jgi:hypothetical protein